MHIIKNTIALSHTKMHYLHAGKNTQEPQKPVMVMLHGFPENSWSWEYYLLHLSDDFHVYAPDLPGYNYSDGLGDADNYTLENLIACFNVSKI